MIETRRGSRHIRFLAAAALVLLIADTALWIVTCMRLDSGAREAAAGAGYLLTADVAHWGGWPVAAEVTLPNTVLRSGPDIIPPLTWTASRATLRLAPWHPTMLTVAASGPQTLAIGAASPTPFAAQTLVATIDLRADDPVHLTAATLDIAAPSGPVTIARADMLLLSDQASVDLSGLTLPGRAGQPITPPIDDLRIDGRIAPPVQPEATASESARRWRDAGGKLDVTASSFRWGPLSATGRATLTLDPALQPVIAGQFTAANLGAMIEQLAQTGAVTRPAATAAGAMLTILSAPSGGGPVTLPVTLRDGVVTVARIPLLRLAPLHWD